MRKHFTYEKLPVIQVNPFGQYTFPYKAWTNTFSSGMDASKATLPHLSSLPSQNEPLTSRCVELASPTFACLIMHVLFDLQLVYNHQHEVKTDFSVSADPPN
jgi:hypothetical protein